MWKSQLLHLLKHWVGSLNFDQYLALLTVNCVRLWSIVQKSGLSERLGQGRVQSPELGDLPESLFEFYCNQRWKMRVLKTYKVVRLSPYDRFVSAGKSTRSVPSRLMTRRFLLQCCGEPITSVFFSIKSANFPKTIQPS